ncbi:hypothetical protein [Gordonia sp. NB41Y]|uniref:hypothetical protein n=1 Tax=Gordonia sp. NB41Y TaxID=875808 RepID=UPI00128F8FE7|nr:hypothetical protein [Gordonia sp. NB41Y]WLP90119.1 hypothetical protein Q9K23_21770 [Gordonia sp. NB41Y]
MSIVSFLTCSSGLHAHRRSPIETEVRILAWYDKTATTVDDPDARAATPSSLGDASSSPMGGHEAPPRAGPRRGYRV